MVWQSLPGWICTFGTLSLFLQTHYLHVVSFFFIIAHTTYEQLFCIYLSLEHGRIWKGLRGPWWNLHIFAVCLSSWASSFILDTEKREKGGKEEKLSFISSIRFFRTLNNINNESIPYRAVVPTRNYWERIQILSVSSILQPWVSPCRFCPSCASSWSLPSSAFPKRSHIHTHAFCPLDRSNDPFLAIKLA